MMNKDIISIYRYKNIVIETRKVARKYMNENVLISTAMLSALWEKNRNDTLDLMLPFLKYSIAKKTQVGMLLNLPEIVEFYKNEFGYKTIPQNVIFKMLNRLSPTFLRKTKDGYSLITNLDSIVFDFEKKRTLCKEHRQIVVKEFTAFLKNHMKNGEVTEADAQLYLLDFFSKKGMTIVWDTAMLESLRYKSDRINYYVAQFILQEYKKESPAFNYILDMVQGFLISTAISLQPENGNISSSKFSNVKFYLDTRIIINALGYHLTEEKDNTREMLKMLTDGNAELFCFKHNYNEIYDIASAYKYCLKNPRNCQPHQTLEKWDELCYTVSDVERVQLNLQSNIEKLNITIIDTPKYDSAQDHKVYIDESGLASYINGKINYKNPEALEVDVNSIASICKLRDGFRTKEIEKCGYIFVTTNSNLVKCANEFLREYNDRGVTPIITDIDLSAIVWLKSYSTHKDYPKAKLLENALLSLEPSQSILSAFYNIIGKIKSEGGITEDEAAILRMDLYGQRELMKLTNGDDAFVNEETIYTIRDRQKVKYIGDEAVLSKLNYDKYTAERDANRTIILNALESINKIGDDEKKSTVSILTRIVWIGIGLMFVIFIITLVMSIIYAEKSYIIPSVIAAFFSLASFTDMLIGKKKIIRRFINRVGNHRKDKAKDKKKEEYISIIGSLEIEE